VAACASETLHRQQVPLEAHANVPTDTIEVPENVPLLTNTACAVANLPAWEAKVNDAYSYDAAISYETNPNLPIARMSVLCQHCNALKWQREPAGMCCAHGQPYVACSRVGSNASLFILTPNGATKNVVYQQALQSMFMFEEDIFMTSTCNCNIHVLPKASIYYRPATTLFNP
jgi:hypothetical protein